ncbi:hypothetical protein [Alloactinosynnema sp. L-07]|nr:hypothetical protein [Alloactinosynnema sp. L-07]
MVPLFSTSTSNPTARVDFGLADAVGTNDLGADTVIESPLPSGLRSPERDGLPAGAGVADVARVSTGSEYAGSLPQPVSHTSSAQTMAAKPTVFTLDATSLPGDGVGVHLDGRRGRMPTLFGR